MKKNKKKQQKALCPLVVFLCMMYLAVLIIPVKAEDKSVTVKIPVTCTGKNTTERFTYEIEGGESEYEQVENRTLTLSDGEEGSFVITCNYPGTYQYTVHQQAGNDEKTTYDDTVYQIDLYVTENEQGELRITPVAYVKGKTEKQEKLSYQNSKAIPSEPEKPEEPVEPEEPATPEEPKKDPEKKTEKEPEKKVETAVVTQVQAVPEPKTGDRSQLWGWSVVSIMALGSIAILGAKRKKQRGRKDA